MNLKRFIIKSSEDLEKAKLFEKYKLGKIKENKNIKCKHCSILAPLEELGTNIRFWKCAKGHNNKYNEKYIRLFNSFEFNYRNILKIIQNKINNPKIINKKDYLLYSREKVDVPIFFFDIPLNISMFLEGLKRTGFFIYFNEKLMKNEITPYNKNNFMDLSSFLKIPSKSIIDKLNVIANSAYPLETLNIFKKISKFVEKNKFTLFEKEITKLFDNLKKNEKKILKLLDVLRHNKNNPSGNKFVNIGSTYPVDIYPIALFSYFRGILEVSVDKAYEAKMSSKRLTFQKYKEKKESNSGRKLVFITSAQEVDNKIWRDIIKARENVSDWFYFIIDLDLLSLILYYVGHKDYFN